MKLLQAEFARNRTVSTIVQLKKVPIYKIFHRGASASIYTTPLGQHAHIKLTLSCKFKHI